LIPETRDKKKSGWNRGVTKRRVEEGGKVLTQKKTRSCCERVLRKKGPVVACDGKKGRTSFRREKKEGKGKKTRSKEKKLSRW